MKYIIFPSSTDYSTIIWSPLRKEKDILFNDFTVKGKIMNSLIWRCYFRTRKSPFNIKFIANIILDKMHLPEDEEYIIIFHENNLLSKSLEFVQAIQSKYKHAKTVYWLSNIIGGADLRNIDNIKKTYDLVITFDKCDAEKYQIVYYEGFYDTIPELSVPLNKTSDVFFIGRDKGRLDFIVSLYDKLTQCGHSCDFLLSGVSENQKIYRDNITYIDYLPYREVISHIISTKCLLEITKEGQSGCTLRVMESIAYKKKLITTNKTIEKCELYDSNNMQVIAEDSTDFPIIESEYIENEINFARIKPRNKLNFVREALLCRK